MSNRSCFPCSSRVLEEQLQSLILRRTQLANDVANQIIPGQLGADAALCGFDPNDVIQMIAAELIGSLEDGFDLRRNRLFAPRPEREHHGKARQRGPFGPEVEYMNAQRSRIEVQCGIATDQAGVG